MDQDRLTRRFHDLVWPYRADVLRVARYLCRDASVADDLAQETLLKAFRSAGGLADGSDARAWLLTILRNTWTDRLRATRRDVTSLDAADEPAAPAPPEPIEFGDDPQRLLEAFGDRQVIDALQALPAEIRWTLLLVDVEGLGVREAADVLGVPAGTVKSRAHRGRAMLRQTLAALAPARVPATADGEPATAGGASFTTDGKAAAARTDMRTAERP